MAKVGEQTLILGYWNSKRGCHLPWRVRVRHANEGTAPFRIYGSIKLDFDDRIRDVPVTGASGILKKGESTTMFLGDRSGFEQGIIQMTSNWAHAIDAGLLIPGGNPIKLRFELIDPSGTAVKTVSAYSSNEARSELPRFNLIYQVQSCVADQWKLKITNTDPDDDAGYIGHNVKFTPGCP
jgi:hypothetical protein